MSPLRAAWHRLFLADVDARPLAALRIGVGLLVLLTFAEYLPILSRAHSNAGWLDAADARDLMGWQHWSLFHYVSSAPMVVLAGIVGVVAALGMVLGVYSRTSAWICFALLASIHVRNPTLLYGADSLTRLLVFYTALSRCGAVWSIDAVRRRVATARADDTPPESPRRFAPVVPVPVWPLRLLQFQFLVIYAFAGLGKVFGTTWDEGTALWFGLLNPVYTRFNPEALPLPEALVPVLALATHFVLLWELLWPLAVVAHPWSRRVAMWIGVAVHGGIFVVFQIKWWGIAMLIGYLGLVAPRMYRWLELRLCRRQRRDLADRRLHYIYDPSNAAHRRAAATVSALDAYGLVRLRPSPDSTTANFVDASGDPVQLRAALRLLPALAPLGLLSRVPLLGPALVARAARKLTAT